VQVARDVNTVLHKMSHSILFPLTLCY